MKFHGPERAHYGSFFFFNLAQATLTMSPSRALLTRCVAGELKNPALHLVLILLLAISIGPEP